jgi:uncharacterized lipoprotein NlpE involved in copper resistance
LIKNRYKCEIVSIILAILSLAGCDEEAEDKDMFYLQE